MIFSTTDHIKMILRDENELVAKGYIIPAFMCGD